MVICVASEVPPCNKLKKPSRRQAPKATPTPTLTPNVAQSTDVTHSGGRPMAGRGRSEDSVVEAILLPAETEKENLSEAGVAAASLLMAK